MPQTPTLAAVPADNTDWSIELLRGLAAVLVVLAHYQPLLGWNFAILRFAYTGVDLFFVLSGFVFAPYLWGKPLAARAHLVRRFFRLYPLYVVALACYAGLHVLQGQPVDHLLKHLLFVYTWETREVAFTFNPAFWSLPPEVEFYLALPLLAALAGQARRDGVTMLAGLLASLLAMALVVHLGLAWWSPVSPSAPFNMAAILGVHLPGLLVEFLFGAMAWKVATHRPGTAVRAVMLGLGLLAWWGLAVLFAALGDIGLGRIDLLRGNTSMLAALAFALMVAAWVGWVKHPAPALIALATRMGNLSYGLYLFHNAMPVVLQAWKTSMTGPGFALLCLAGTLLLAQLLHWAVEAPCRQFGRRLAAQWQAAR